MDNPARTDFHHDEDVEELESRRDNGQEVGGDDPLRVISVMKEGQNIDLEALPTVRPYRAW